MKKITSTNPSNGVTLGQVEISNKEEILNKVNEARKALKTWRDLGVKGRIKELQKVVDGFKKYSNEFSELISKEMGMPISQSHHDVSGAIEYMQWYLNNAEEYLNPEVVYEDEEMIHTVYREPVGVVAAITPWNFPASNFIWMVGQNLVVGNTVVFKDSEEVPLCGQLIENIFTEANLPEGVFSEIYGGSEEGDILVNSDIDMICFTGSSATGHKLYQIAANKFIKAFLELGGSAPGIVFEDTDIDDVLETIYSNRFDNCGQICDGLKRLIVHESKYEEMIEKLINYLNSVKVGNASDESTDIGPLVSSKQLEALKNQVEKSVEKGAEIIYKKEIDSTLKGHFYSPILMKNITPEMEVWNEEVFGPVLPIVTFKTEKEAILLANDTKYGLGGYVFTGDKDRFKRVALQIESGMIQQNNTSYVTPSSPFGGCKISGIGRENGKYGFFDLTEVKLVVEAK